MTLRQIQYVVEADRQGSLSSAAKALFISQSTLSFSIKELERETGITIFERSRNGIKATPDGTAFLAKARQALLAVNELETISARPQQSVSRLRVSSVQSGIVPVALCSLARQMEESSVAFRLRCKLGETSEVIEAAAEGQCDVGFIYATDRQEVLWRSILMQKSLQVQPVYRTELYILLNAGDPLARYDALELSQLSGHTFVFVGDGGLDGFSNLADYSMQNFDLNGHAKYFDAQDSMLLNYLLHRTKSFSIGHRSPTLPYYDGLAFVPIRKRQFVQLLAIFPANVEISRELAKLFELFHQME